MKTLRGLFNTMYLEHFGLSRPPFKITPDTTLFYTGSKRGAALDALQYAILSGEGIIKVVGEVGSGKTMLCRMLEQELPPHVEVVYIANPSLAPENILHVVAFELKLPVSNDTNRLTVMQLLQEYLLQKHAANRQVVVFVEEAQSMPIATLEEIRLLSNLETNDHKLLQMVLFGQPELDEKLRDPSIRQLKERITHSFYLDPFPRSDIFEYLNFRMRAVGYRGPDIFSAKVASNIEKKSHGLTRRINILADKALLAVYAEGGHGITAKHINIAARDSDFGQATWHVPGWTRNAGLAAGLLLLVVIAVWIGTLLPHSEAEQANNSTQLSAAVLTPPPVPTPIKHTASPITTNHNQATIPAASESLQQMLDQTAIWLQNIPDDIYTIQLSLIESWAPDKAEMYLQQAMQLAGNENIHVYQAVIGGKAVYSVLYSEYQNRAAAIAALQSLPPGLRIDGAYLRRLKGIKADIRMSQATGELKI